VRVLADTSVWVSYLRTGAAGPAAPLDDLLARQEVVVCGPVAAELLVGAAGAQRHELWTLLAGLDWADLGRAQWREVGETAAMLRERGQSVPLTDVEIAVAARAAGARLWSDDADFDRIEPALPGLERFGGP
jgi:predicted nucleic acid-binding protein